MQREEERYTTRSRSGEILPDRDVLHYYALAGAPACWLGSMRHAINHSARRRILSPSTNRFNFTSPSDLRRWQKQHKREISRQHRGRGIWRASAPAKPASTGPRARDLPAPASTQLSAQHHLLIGPEKGKKHRGILI